MSARDVIQQLGGIRPLSEQLGHKNHTTVQGWWERDVIPVRQQALVLEAAKDAGTKIEPTDLIPGFNRAAGRAAA